MGRLGFAAMAVMFAGLGLWFQRRSAATDRDRANGRLAGVLFYVASLLFVFAAVYAGNGEG